MKTTILEQILTHTDVESLIKLALTEDGIQNDLTTKACQLGDRNAHAQVIAKSQCIATGFPLVEKIVTLAGGPQLKVTNHTQEGALLPKGTTWFEIDGHASKILAVERTILNFLMRMCGIATTTHEFTKRIAHTNCKILHTRKTAPGHRRTDIYASLIGGAYPHRRSLDDAILVKENHLRSAASFQTVFDGINTLRAQASFVEIEVTNLVELKHALAAKPNRILLDNFSVEEIKKALTLFSGTVEFEASGGINLSNCKEYAETGVEYISTGSITHSAPATDLSLLFEMKS